MMPISCNVVATGNLWRRSSRRRHAAIGCCSVRLVALRSLPAVQSKASLQARPVQENKRTQSEQRQNEEEEDEEAVSERRVLIVPSGTAVHTATVTTELTKGRSPTFVTVTVPVTVTHPMSMTLALHVTVVVQDVGAATLKVHTNLVVSTLGSITDHPGVGDVRPQPEVDAVTLDPPDGGADEVRLYAEHRHLLDV